MLLSLLATTAVPPVIKEHPKDISVSIGKQVTFTCQATSGDGDITYLWQRVDNGSELDLSRTRGINSNELIISNVSPDDAGSYVCIASNKNGQTKSRKAILDVQGLCTLLIVSSVFRYTATVAVRNCFIFCSQMPHQHFNR